jgi:phosphate transport system ATP-binding protein
MSTETTLGGISVRKVNVYYGENRAVIDVSMDIVPGKITALIGPSGCGKTTLLRSLNRMNDLIPGVRTEGEVFFRGVNILEPTIDAVQVRRWLGMVFQKPNPFPKSIFENIAWGARLHGYKGDYEELVVTSLQSVALFDEVKDKLHKSAFGLSGGQQQRLCIARTIAIHPDVILMDEPTSALDPISTAKIEDLLDALKTTYTIVIVTHNMQQAGRISDKTGFMLHGILEEFNDTDKIFFNPQNKKTEAYISGRFS